MTPIGNPIGTPIVLGFQHNPWKKQGLHTTTILESKPLAISNDSVISHQLVTAGRFHIIINVVYLLRNKKIFLFYVIMTSNCWQYMWCKKNVITNNNVVVELFLSNCTCCSEHTATTAGQQIKYLLWCRFLFWFGLFVNNTNESKKKTNQLWRKIHLHWAGCGCKDSIFYIIIIVIIITIIIIIIIYYYYYY